MKHLRMHEREEPQITYKKLTFDEFSNYIDKQLREVDASSEKDYDDLLYVEQRDSFTHSTYYGIIVRGKIVGYAAVPKRNEQYLDKLFINHDERRKGYAVHALDYLNIHYVYVLEKNVASIAFYKSSGFIEAKKQDTDGMILLER